MFTMIKIEDNYAACCCSQCIAVCIAMSLKIITEDCFVKEFKTEEKSKLGSVFCRDLIESYTYLNSQQNNTRSHN